MKQKTIVLSLYLLVPAIVLAQQNVGMSDAGFLTSMQPDPPSLSSPANAATQSPDAVTVIWHSKIHTATYTLQVSEAADFPDLLVSETGTDTTFTFTNLDANTTYYWRVFGTNVAGDGDCSETRKFTTSSSSVDDGKTASIPTSYALLPVYPNPFNPRTMITYHLPEKADVSLIIYNNMGQSIQELVSGLQQAGEYKVAWNGRDDSGTFVSSGLYICHFNAGNRVFTQKVLLMR